MRLDLRLEHLQTRFGEFAIQPDPIDLFLMQRRIGTVATCQQQERRSGKPKFDHALKRNGRDGDRRRQSSRPSEKSDVPTIGNHRAPMTTAMTDRTIRSRLDIV